MRAVEPRDVGAFNAYLALLPQLLPSYGSASDASSPASVGASASPSTSAAYEAMGSGGSLPAFAESVSSNPADAGSPRASSGRHAAGRLVLSPQVAGAIASFLPTDCVALTWMDVSATAHAAGRAVIAARRLAQSQPRGALRAISVEFCDGVRATWFVVLRSVFVWAPPIRPGFIVDGCVRGVGACEQLVAPECGGVVREVSGTWRAGDPAHAPVIVEVPRMVGVTAHFESGATCRMGNFVVAPARADHLAMVPPELQQHSAATQRVAGPPEVFIGEAALVLPATATQPRASIIAGEIEVPKLPGEPAVHVLGRCALRRVPSLSRWLSLERLLRHDGHSVALRVLVDGCARSSIEIPRAAGITLSTPLAAVRAYLLAECATAALPDGFRFFMPRAAQQEAATDGVDEHGITVMDALPPNRAPFLWQSLRRPWAAASCGAFGWPADVACAYDRVLALVLVPAASQSVGLLDAAETPISQPQQPALNSSPSHSHSYSSLALGELGSHRVRNVRHLRARESVREVPASLQVYVMALGAALDACRSGDVVALRAVLDGGRGQLIGGGKARRATPIDVPPLSASEPTPTGFSLLHTAVEHGRLEAVALLLDHGASVLLADGAGRLPIHVAAHRGHAECFPRLLSAPRGRETLNVPDGRGRTPVHTCLYAGFVNTALWLVEQGADVERPDEDGVTPAELAVRQLPTIADAAAAGDERAVRLMLRAAGPPPPHDAAAAVDDVAVTEWYAASLRHRLTRGRLLVECVAAVAVAAGRGDVITNVLRWGALHAAAHRGHASVCAALLSEAGARLVDIAAANSAGDTALHCAAAANNVEAARALLANPGAAAALCMRNNRGQTPLHVALAARSARRAPGHVAALLLRATPSAVLRQRDAAGMTPCHYSLLLPPAHAELMREVLSSALTGLEKASEEEKCADGAWNPDASTLQRAFEARHASWIRRCEQRSKRKQQQYSHRSSSSSAAAAASGFPSLVDVCIVRRDVSLLRFVIEFMQRNVAAGRWPRGALGTVAVEDLRRAFHCNTSGAFELLLERADLASVLPAAKIPCAVGGAPRRDTPLLAYILLRAPSAEWIDVATTAVVRCAQPALLLDDAEHANVLKLLVRERRFLNCAAETIAAVPTAQPPFGAIGLRPTSAGAEPAPMPAAATTSPSRDRSTSRAGSMAAAASSTLGRADVGSLQAMAASITAPTGSRPGTSGAATAATGGVALPLVLSDPPVTDRAAQRAAALHERAAARRFAALQARWAHRQQLREAADLAVSALARVTEALCPATGDDAALKESFRACAFAAAAVCGDDRASFSTLQPVLSGELSCDPVALLDSMGLRTNFAQAPGAGVDVQQQSLLRTGAARASVAGSVAGGARGQRDASPSLAQLSPPTDSFHLSNGASAAPSPSARRTSTRRASTSATSAGVLSACTPGGASLAARCTHLVALLPFARPTSPAALLHHTCMRRHFGVAMALLQRTPGDAAAAILRSGELEDASGTTALHTACDFGAAQLVAALLRTAQFGAEEECVAGGLRPIHCAARHGHAAVLQVLFAAGVDPGAVVGSATDNGVAGRRLVRLGTTALHLAAGGGHVECVRALLDHGAAVDARNTDRRTALHVAAMRGHERVVDCLVQRGAVVHRRDAAGDTPILLAARRGFGRAALRLATLCKNEGMLLSSTNPSTGETVAHFAAFWGDTATLERVITADRQRQRASERRRSSAPAAAANSAGMLLRRRSSIAVRRAGEPPRSQSELGIGGGDVRGGAALSTASPFTAIGAALWAATPATRLQCSVTGALVHMPDASPPTSSEALATTKVSPSVEDVGADSPGGASSVGVRAAAPMTIDISTATAATLAQRWVTGPATTGSLFGVAKLGVALRVAGASLASAGTPKAAGRATDKAEVASGATAPLSIFHSLFTAAVLKRERTGDDEADDTVTTAACVITSLPGYKAAFELSASFSRERADEDAPLHHVSTVTSSELVSGHRWQPWHYAMAQQRSAVCALLRKSGYGDAAATREMQRQSGRNTSAPPTDLATTGEGAAPATPPPFPAVSAAVSDATAAAIKRAAATVFALPPPPPPPMPRWFDGHYGRGPRGHRGTFGTLGAPSYLRSVWAQWRATAAGDSANALMDAAVLTTIAWCVRRGLCSEVARRLPLLTRIDAPLMPNGATLLMLAAYSGCEDVVAALADAGADIQARCRLAEPRSPVGTTALHLAAMNGHMRTVERLLALGADPNAGDENGNTPLHFAVLRKNFDMAKLLLRNQAAIHHTNHRGETAEDIVTCLRDSNVVRLLRWWARSSVVQLSSDVDVHPCRAARDFAPWIDAAATYHRRLDALHNGYVALSNRDPDHSVPCLMYEKVCTRLQVAPARSVLAQLLPYWWPEEVREIDLGGIYLGGAAMAAVFTLAKVLPRLESIDLTGAKLTNEVVADLCVAVGSHPFLRKLIISHNKEVNVSKPLVELLEANRRLVVLDVAGTAIPPPVQAHILRLAEANKRAQAHCYADREFVAARASPLRSRAATASPAAPERMTSSAQKQPTRHQQRLPRHRVALGLATM